MKQQVFLFQLKVISIETIYWEDIYQYAFLIWTNKKLKILFVNLMQHGIQTMKIFGYLMTH